MGTGQNTLINVDSVVEELSKVLDEAVKDVPDTQEEEIEDLLDT